MLVECEQPDCFSKLSDSHVFYALNDDRGLYGYLAVYLDCAAIIHLEIFRFSVSAMKHMLKEWAWVRSVCKDANCSNIIVMGDIEKGHKWDRFVKAFGFPQPREIKISTMEV